MALCLLILESVSRLFAPPYGSKRWDQVETLTIKMDRGFAHEIFEAHDERFWSLKPSITLPSPPESQRLSGRLPLWWGAASNSRGFRNKEPVVLPSGEPQVSKRKILCIGDSTTFGAGVAREEAWPNRLETYLDSTEVINAGVPGYTSYQGLVYLKELLKKQEPNIVIATFGNNDAWPWDNYSDQDHARTFKTSRAKQIRRFLLRNSALARLAAHQIQKMSPKPEDSNLESWAPHVLQNESGNGSKFIPRVSLNEYAFNIDAMIKLCRSHNVSLYLVVWPWRSQLENQGSPRAAYQEVTRVMALRRNIPVLDVAAHLQAQGLKPDTLYLDGVHVNPLGNRLVSQFVLRKLAQSPPTSPTLPPLSPSPSGLRILSETPPPSGSFPPHSIKKP